MPERQFDIFKNFIKGQGYSLASFTRKLKKSRQTVYTQLNKVPLEDEFISLVKKETGLDLSKVPISNITATKFKSGQEKKEFEKLKKENEELKKELDALKDQLLKILLKDTK